MDAAKIIEPAPLLRLLTADCPAPEKADCPICEASGDADDCKACGDTRVIDADEVRFYVDCPECDGDRSMGMRRCDTCKGYGVCHEDDARDFAGYQAERAVGMGW